VASSRLYLSKWSLWIAITVGRGGGVNQLLPCLNNYASFKIFTRHSMMITIMQRDKQKAHSASVTYMRKTETDNS
jgi:hypothetical protein